MPGGFIVYFRGPASELFNITKPKKPPSNLWVRRSEMEMKTGREKPTYPHPWSSTQCMTSTTQSWQDWFGLLLFSIPFQGLGLGLDFGPKLPPGLGREWTSFPCPVLSDFDKLPGVFELTMSYLVVCIFWGIVGLVVFYTFQDSLRVI